MATPLAVERLDRTRPFGTVHGEADEIAYAQRWGGLEGWPYNHAGDLLEKHLNKAQRTLLAERRAKKAAAPAAKAEAAPADDFDDAAVHVEEIVTPKADDNDEFNAEMFLTGKIRYTPRQVQAALKQRYHVNKPGTAQAALYLVEEKNILPREQVHPSILPRA